MMRSIPCRSILILAVPLLLVATSACGGDSTGGNSTSIVYNGVFAGDKGTESGSFAATVVVEDSSGTGFFVANGTRQNFSTIIYDSTSFSGTGGGYTFVGTVSDSGVYGTYSSAGGTGRFIALSRLSGVTTTSYCGTHIGTHLGVPIAGPFAYLQQGSNRRGVFASVLGDPFKGVLKASPGGGPTVLLDTLTGSADVVSSVASFSGTYATAAGDTGAVAGPTCPSSPGVPVGSIYNGVLGSYDGVESGEFDFNITSTGVGSTGSYTVGGVAKNFLAVISGVNSQVAGFDSTFRVIATIATDTVEGTYTNQGSGAAGKLGGLNLHGTNTEAWCGTNSGGGIGNGAFSFLMRPDSSIFGIFTGGAKADLFQGLVTGSIGNDASSMEGVGGPVSVLASVGAFSGVYPLAGGGTGTVTGALCP